MSSVIMPCPRQGKKLSPQKLRSSGLRAQGFGAEVGRGWGGGGVGNGGAAVAVVVFLASIPTGSVDASGAGSGTSSLI